MLYIVLMPVKPDNIRKLVVIWSANFAEVRQILGLPQAWMSWVALTQEECKLPMLTDGKYIEKLISCNDY